MKNSGYTVKNTKNTTGETREYRDDCEWSEHSLWWWTEGNMGCDCNRELEFESVQNSKFDADNIPCSEGRFSVTIVFDNGSEKKLG